MDIPPEDQSTLPEHIDVKVDGLADFAHDLRYEVENNLRPYIDELANSYRTAPDFGATVASDNIGAARAHYQRCLGQMLDQLYTIAQTGTILADAADHIVQQYRNADALGVASVSSVNDAVSWAVHHAPYVGPVDPTQDSTGVPTNGPKAM